MHTRQGVLHFRVKGKGDKIRFVPVHAAALRLIEDYLALAGYGADTPGPLYRPVKNNRTPEKLDRPLDPASVYRNIVRHYGLLTGISAEVNEVGVHGTPRRAWTIYFAGQNTCESDRRRESRRLRARNRRGI